MRISILISTVAVAGLAAAETMPAPRPHAHLQTSGPVSLQSNPVTQPPSQEELRERTKKVVNHQHDNDVVLELYERVERHILRTGGESPRTLEDKTYRVVPTGVGNQRILLHEEGKPVDSTGYARQMHILEDTLATMANPNDPKAKAANAKFEKRERERAQFVDAASEAYTTKWVGREGRNGRDCDVVELIPNPKFQPRSMLQEVFGHTTAKMWVDHGADQIVHGEVHVTSDVSFGGGILGKLYRGSVVSLDQAEIAPGIWLPIRYQYDFAGRKFLFSFDQHQLIEVSRYRRIGPPKEALQVVQSELSSGQAFSEDP